MIAGATSARVITLAARPRGPLTPDCFAVAVEELPALAPGEVRVQAEFLSLDPYLRGAVDQHPLHGAPVPLGAVAPGRAVGRVVASLAPGFAPGDLVRAEMGWRAIANAPARLVKKLPDGPFPPSWHLGVFGSPGLTAWLGNVVVGRLKAGETVLVSSAVGAVGMTAGQLAKRAGCRVIGIAGGPEKCRLGRDLGYDEMIDYRAEPDLAAAIRRTAPGGLDFYFDNVGEATLDAALANLNDLGRVGLCGHIAAYDRLGSADTGLRWFRLANRKRWKLDGFSVRDYPERWDEGVADMMNLAAQGRLRQVETVIEGLEQAGAGLADLIAGRLVGKAVVRVT